MSEQKESRAQPSGSPGPKKRNIAGAINDLFSKYQGFKIVFAVVLATLAFLRVYYYETLSTRMDLIFLALVLAVFLLWMIPWEQFWERLSGFNVGGVGISLQQPDVQAAINHISFDEEHLKISGPASSEAVRERLRRRLKSLEGELQTVRESRVLWIDDEPHSILGERRLLRALGIDITPATSSTRAQEILKEDHDFDLIITDTLRGSDTPRGSRRRGTRASVDSDSEGVDSDSEGVDSLRRGKHKTREGVDFIVKLRKGEVIDAPGADIKDLPVIFYVADPWETVEDVTSRARNLEPRAEISNSVDDLIPKVIRLLSEQRQNPIPVKAKKTSSPSGVDGERPDNERSDSGRSDSDTPSN